MNIFHFPVDCVKSVLSLLTNSEEKPLQNYTTTEIILGGGLVTAALASVVYFFYKKKKSIHDDNEYSIILFPENNQNFKVNDIVFVMKDKKPFAKAIITKDVENDKTNKFYGRFEVEYLISKAKYHTRKDQLIRVEDSKTQKIIFICETTHEYRRIAKTQLDKNDTVLEIGSDFGDTTKIIHPICKKVIGIDKSKVHVDRAKKLYPEIQFECLDVFLKVDKFKEIGKDCNKIFIDINGNREYQAVVDLVILVQNLFNPEMIVVKSINLKELYKKKNL